MNYDPILTEDDRKHLTYFNCLAFDIARKEAAERDTRIPVFLCTSDMAKAKYRKMALKILNDNLNPIIPFDDTNIDTVESYLKKALPANMIQAWIDIEAELKKQRDKNNLQAFFV